MLTDSLTLRCPLHAPHGRDLNATPSRRPWEPWARAPGGLGRAHGGPSGLRAGGSAHPPPCVLGGCGKLAMGHAGPAADEAGVEVEVDDERCRT